METEMEQVHNCQQGRGRLSIQPSIQYYAK